MPAPGSVRALAGALSLAAACGTDAEPARGIELAVPGAELAAGSERTYCYYTTLVTPAGTALRRWESEISGSGHGLQVFATPTPLQPDGTVSDTCTFQGTDHHALPRLLYTATRGTDSAELAPGFALPIAERQPIVVRVHLINASDQPSRAVVRLRAEPTDEAYVAAAVFASYRSDLAVAPGATAMVDGACDLPPDVSVLRLSTLTLRYATRVEVSDEVGVLLQSFDSSHPGELDARSLPRQVTGRLHYRCEYFNPTATAIAAGGVDGQDELCMIMAYVAPASGDLSCIDDVLQP